MEEADSCMRSELTTDGEDVERSSAREPAEIGGSSTAPMMPRSAQNDRKGDGARAQFHAGSATDVRLGLRNECRLVIAGQFWDGLGNLRVLSNRGATGCGFAGSSLLMLSRNLLLSAVLFLGTCLAAAQAASKPNIIFILCDDL